MKDNLQAMDEKNTEQSMKMMREGELLRLKKQKKREVLAAVNLAKLLEPYFGDESEDHLNFRLKIIGEAKELAGTPFGGTLIGVLVIMLIGICLQGTSNRLSRFRLQCCCWFRNE